MNREDIIRMAREAGCRLIEDYYTNGIEHSFDNSVLERFVALVAAAERKECALLCIKNSNLNKDILAPVSQFESGGYLMAEFLAKSINARGQQ